MYYQKGRGMKSTTPCSAPDYNLVMLRKASIQLQLLIVLIYQSIQSPYSNALLDSRLSD